MGLKHRRASIQTETPKHKSSHNYKVHTRGGINYHADIHREKAGVVLVLAELNSVAFKWKCWSLFLDLIGKKGGMKSMLCYYLHEPLEKQSKVFVSCMRNT